MPITREVEQEIASAEWTDECRVRLRTRRKLSDLSIADARQLADELRDAAQRAEDALTALFKRPTPPAHAFDLQPMCRDCREGKHTACIGSTFVETGTEVDEVACQCDVAGHPEVAS